MFGQVRLQGGGRGANALEEGEWDQRLHMGIKKDRRTSGMQKGKRRGERDEKGEGVLGCGV